MRKGFVLALATAAILAPAVPAQAKGAGDEMAMATSATVDGPGIKTPITINDRNITNRPYGFALADELRLFEGAAFPAPPQGGLGPRYLMATAFSCTGPDGRSESAVIHEDLYPFARYGPWLHSRGVQAGCFGLSLQKGWYTVTSGTMDLLQSAGFPETAPAAAHTATPPAGAASPAIRPWIILALALAMSLMVVVGALAGRRRSERMRLAG